MTRFGGDRQRTRRQIRVRGTVQGVGFRPHVYRLAHELALGGWVLNDSEGVLLEIEGGPERVAAFGARLAPEAPPLARIEATIIFPRPARGEHRFVIHDSPPAALADTPVAPDSATCPDCLAELADPGDRRHRYPFINCTNCGPRFTIVRGVPYDRPLTTMADFAMCAACLAEYRDPANRRFHAQPNACPDCGPSLRLVSPVGATASPGDGDPLRTAALALRDGAIVAVKGIGGFHLACRADDAAAVTALRARKHREDRPFALMAASLAHAEALVALNDSERALLMSAARPIVLAPRRAGATVADAVAPRVGELGVMLPYSPLHHLLLAEVAAAAGCGLGGGGPALVMTSANRAGEPIAFGEADAREQLAGIADLILSHDRPIQTRTDDSVLRVVATVKGPQPMFLRRSRGYVPAHLALPVSAGRPILACGAELKNTVCVARGRRAWVSHHIGDLRNYETLSSYAAAIAHFRALFSVQPGLVVRDLHPDYLSSRFADALAEDGAAGIDTVVVQHHHAHLAACLAEHGETGLAVGAIFDGSGYGPDGTVWGGELLVGDLGDFRRVGALAPVRLPGGERAVTEPWRMACAWLVAAGSAGGAAGEAGEAPAMPGPLAAAVDPRRWQLVAEMARTGVASPITTSMGRLFDAVAALCGIRSVIVYEGQAAVELEASCDPAERGAYELSVSHPSGGLIQIDPAGALSSVIGDQAAGVATATIAARFHAGVAAATVRACVAAAGAAGTERVVLSGGVFQNRRLVESTALGLHQAGLRVLLPRRLPPGDGGISYGQAAVAAWTSQLEGPRS